MENKEDEISVLLENERSDIVAFTETWLHSDILDDEGTFDGYQMFRQDRSFKRGGGVLLLCRPYLNPALINSAADAEGWLCCQIKYRDEYASIGLAYRSPHSKGDLILEQMQRVTNSPNCLILGDFNTPEIDWGTPSCWGSEQAFCAELLGRSLFWGLTQHTRYPTRAVPGQNESILDLVLSHEEDDMVNVNYSEPTGRSDHTTLMFE